ATALPGVGEPIPDSRHGQYVERPRGHDLDLAPKVADVDVDDARLDRILVAPDCVQDLLAAEHLARVAGQVGEEVELGVRQVDLAAAAEDAPLVDVDHEVFELEPATVEVERLRARLAQVGRDARHQLAHS